MTPKSIWRVVATLESCSEDYDDLRIEEQGLYRHACALRTEKGRPLGPFPTEIIETCAWSLYDFTMGWPATLHPEMPEKFLDAAEWAFLIFSDLYGEFPPDGGDEGYLFLTTKVFHIRQSEQLRSLEDDRGGSPS